MQNIKTISDSDLLKQIRLDAECERKHGLAVIHQLREIKRRRLDAQLGYSSLHSFCMEELKYSSTSAWRRVKVMEALEELPELEAQIVQGNLTLTNLSQVQNFCEQKEKTLEEKREILAQVSGLSKRDTERKLAQIAPIPERPEKVRPLDQDLTELRVTLSKETLATLDKIRGLIVHSHPGASYADIIYYLAKLGLKKLDPALKGAPQARVTSRSQVPASQTQVPAAPSASSSALVLSASTRYSASPQFPPVEKSDAEQSPSNRSASSSSPAVPAAIRRAVWQRDRGRCGYVSPETGRICGATSFLQIDHAVPRSRGGGNDVSNLRLRCRRHNLLAAVQILGAEKMRPYLK